jgi:tRNA dimethylallyltransferase
MGGVGETGAAATLGRMHRPAPDPAPVRAVGLAGPTGSGKSALALAFAQAAAARGRAVEIVSVDSALVYRGMDIGTAKPTPAERAAVPHHLIDIVDPAEPYSAARFAADARRLVDEIAARGALALLVGGTMLYFKALREGLAGMPAADAALRAEIERRAASEGWPALHAELARIDPETAARLAPGDAQRVQRALEVWQLSGRPLSDWHRQATQGLPMPLVTLEPSERGWLHARLAARWQAMVAAGLLDEVAALRARGDLHAALPSMRCVGYRQAWAELERRAAGRAGDDGAWQQAALAATRQLAKRQATWLRSMSDRHVVRADADDATKATLRALARAAGWP